MKNFWLDKKEEKKREELYARMRDGVKRRTELRKAVKKSFNAKFLEEAKQIEKAWAKSGLLNGLKKYSRQQTAVLLESRRLVNEHKYSLTVRTKNTMHRHGFMNLEDMYRHIDMLCNDQNYYITFSETGECQPADDHEMVLTMWENGGYGSEGRILCPTSAKGAFDGYDNWRKQCHTSSKKPENDYSTDKGQKPAGN
jgi:hypothetical protein